MSIDVQNEAAHKILSVLLEYSKEMNIHRDELQTNIMKNKSLLEKQRNDLKKIQESSAEVTKIISQLPIMLSDKVKDQEGIIKRYEEKFESLEEKELELRRWTEDFGRHLVHLSQEFVERLRTEAECQEALKNLRTEKKQEESNVMNDAMKSLQEAVAAVCDQTKVTEDITACTVACTSDVIENCDSRVSKFILFLRLRIIIA